MEKIRRCEYTHCNKCLEGERTNKRFWIWATRQCVPQTQN